MSEKSVLRPIDVSAFYAALAEKQGGIAYARATDTVRPDIYAGDSVLRMYEQIKKSDVGAGTNLQQAIDYVKDKYDTVIVFTDMQIRRKIRSTGEIKDLYVFNLSSYENNIAVKGNTYMVSGFDDTMFKLCQDLSRKSKETIQQIKQIEL
jgi:hypothetical protein